MSIMPKRAKRAKFTYENCIFRGLAPGGGRTHNLWLRRPTLYPVELRMRQVSTIGSVGNGVKRNCTTENTKRRRFVFSVAQFLHRDGLADLAHHPQVGRDDLNDPIQDGGENRKVRVAQVRG